ncbi:hypothetical protein I4641_00130 [Waterburya agarophytonicola K14]|uniref:EndoU domain-containing protein n=1 Tax=Waterburya agarophytonicola KI4 TaxID=2874699 RepID=A0A964BMH2_9CYAN|nr:hypothetical protein [Waterburya agarophytonicola KI4]
MTDIYQQIWNCDRHKFLVSPRDLNGQWIDPNADILLDEQIAASRRQDLDLARKPLFYRVNEEKLNTIPTYVSLIKLLDNYQFDNQKSEVVTKLEKAEIEQFIDDILPTKPIEIARNYIYRNLNFETSIANFELTLKSIWFDLYTNYFGNFSVRDTSGFEHIFVGEGKYDLKEKTSDRISGEISGYHSWVKFYLDEQQQQVNYRGHNYELQGNIGIDNPYVVAVQMLWQDCDVKSNLAIELFKKKGCFFVGTSPECEIAMGTVAYYESLANYKFEKEKRRTTINGAVYDLALYRNIELDGNRGNYIRSFYPKFIR